MTKIFCNRCDTEVKTNVVTLPNPLQIKEYGDGHLCDECRESLNKWMEKKNK